MSINTAFVILNSNLVNILLIIYNFFIWYVESFPQ